MASDVSKVKNYLYESLDYLSDREIKGDDLKAEIERSKAITNVAGKIIENARLQLDALEIAGEYGVNIPDMFLEDKENA